MNSQPDSFFGKAASIRLTPDEKDSLKEKFKIHVRNGNDVRLEHHMNQQQFLTAAQNVRLSASEKVQMREVLLADIEHSAQYTVRSFGGLVQFFSGCVAAVMIFVLAGAGVSYAAESSLPGDALYAVKVNLTEPFLLRFNNSVEAKVRVRARLATRRLEEAQTLAERSQLTADKVAIVNERLIAHINALESDLKELEMLNKESSATIALETSTEIQAHENVLLRMVSDEEKIRVEHLLTTTRKGRKITDDATQSAHADTVRLTKITAEKAEKAISKAKAAQHAAENTIVSDTLKHAEDDLKVSGDTETSVRVSSEKATSALLKAKEVNLMLRIKGRRALIQLESTKNDNDATLVPMRINPQEQSNDRSDEGSSISSSPASVSSTFTSSSDPSATSSSVSSTSSSVSVSASASIDASASVSASVGDVLKKD